MFTVADVNGCGGEPKWPWVWRLSGVWHVIRRPVVLSRPWRGPSVVVAAACGHDPAPSRSQTLSRRPLPPYSRHTALVVVVIQSSRQMATARGLFPRIYVHRCRHQSFLQPTQARFPFNRNRLRCVRCVKFSRNKRKRQPIGMLGRSSGNHDWLLANASACVSCGFRLRQRTQRKRLRLNGNRASAFASRSITTAVWSVVSVWSYVTSQLPTSSLRCILHG